MLSLFLILFNLVFLGMLGVTVYVGTLVP